MPPSGAQKVPYRQSLELNRLVLLDEVKAPAESWFAARCFRQAHTQGIRGILAHSDPQPRLRQTPHGPEPLFPGHVGTIYQALNMHYLQRTRARTLTVLPDGSVLASGVRAGSHRTIDDRKAASQQVDHHISPP